MADSLSALIVHVTYIGGSPPGDVHLEASEYVRIGANRTISVIRRGWASSINDQGVDIEIMEMEQSARHSLLPCNAEETGEVQEWEMIQRKLKRYGVEVTIDDLKNTPVMVVIEPRLHRMVNKFNQSNHH